MAHLGTGSCGSVIKEPFFFIINKMWLDLGSGLGFFFCQPKRRKKQWASGKEHPLAFSKDDVKYL